MELNSIANSATSLITHAQNKAASAAQTIATLPVQKDEVGGSSEFSSGDLFKPVLSLKEAEQETQAGVKLLQADKKMIGLLLNTKA